MDINSGEPTVDATETSSSILAGMENFKGKKRSRDEEFGYSPAGNQYYSQHLQASRKATAKSSSTSKPPPQNVNIVHSVGSSRPGAEPKEQPSVPVDFSQGSYGMAHRIGHKSTSAESLHMTPRNDAFLGTGITSTTSASNSARSNQLFNSIVTHGTLTDTFPSAAGGLTSSSNQLLPPPPPPPAPMLPSPFIPPYQITGFFPPPNAPFFDRLQARPAPRIGTPPVGNAQVPQMMVSPSAAITNNGQSSRSASLAGYSQSTPKAERSPSQMGGSQHSYSNTVPVAQREQPEYRQANDGFSDAPVFVVVRLKRRADVSHETFLRCLEELTKELDSWLGFDFIGIILPPSGSNCYAELLKTSASHRDIHEVMFGNVSPELQRLMELRNSYLEEPPLYRFSNCKTIIYNTSDGGTVRSAQEPQYIFVPTPSTAEPLENLNGSMEKTRVKAVFQPFGKGVQSFMGQYQRNNKKGGCKNLRCFPHCRNGKHSDIGFCGEPIRVSFSILFQVPVADNRAFTPTAIPLIACARFLPQQIDPVDEEMVIENSGPLISVGDTITEETMAGLLRDRDRPQAPWIEGVRKDCSVVATKQTLCFEFNGESRAWHYGWSGTKKQSAPVLHCFQVLFFLPLGGSGKQLRCIHSLRSDPFSIVSSRRWPSHKPRSSSDGETQEKSGPDPGGLGKKRKDSKPSHEQSYERDIPPRQTEDQMPWEELYAILIACNE